MQTIPPLQHHHLAAGNADRAGGNGALQAVGLGKVHVRKALLLVDLGARHAPVDRHGLLQHGLRDALRRVRVLDEGLRRTSARAWR
jgi:hypothetical protein